MSSTKAIPGIRSLLLILALVYSSAMLGALERLPEAEELATCIGWTMDTALTAKGIPENIFSYRGERPEEDNVVFYYSDHFYLFWFHDRVWQVRVDKRWKGEIDGIRMGMPRSEVEELWGSPINNFDPQPTWTLPDRGYPVRARLYFDGDGFLTDLYVYRSDW